MIYSEWFRYAWSCFLGRKYRLDGLSEYLPDLGFASHLTCKWDLFKDAYALPVTLFFQDLKCFLCSLWVIMSASQEEAVILASFTLQCKIIFSLWQTYLADLSIFLLHLWFHYCIIFIWNCNLPCCPYLSFLSRSRNAFSFSLLVTFSFFFLAQNVFIVEPESIFCLFYW